MMNYQQDKAKRIRKARTPAFLRDLTFDERVQRIMSDIQTYKDEGWSASLSVRKAGYNDLFISEMRSKSRMLNLFFMNYNYKYEEK